MYLLRLALIYLTLLPIAPKKKVPSKDWGRSVKLFSTVGLIAALLSVLIFILFLLFDDLYLNDSYNKKWLLALAIFVGQVVLTGGLHIDGLMDSFDGIAASKNNREDTLKVMKDSHVGAFAVIAAMIVLFSKIISLVGIPTQDILAYLLLVPILSRTLVVFVIAYSSSAYKGSAVESKSSDSLRKNMKLPRDLIINMIPLALFLLICVTWNILLVTALTTIFSLFTFKYLAKKLYGHSGDTYGAGIEITEAIGYFLAALIVH